MKHRIIIPANLSRLRVDRVTAELLPHSTREAVKRWMKDGLVKLNGQTCRPRDKVKTGDELWVEEGPEPLSEALPDPSVEVESVFEDEHLIVVNKPAGMVVHPAPGHPSRTLVNGLLARDDFKVPPADPLDEAGHLRPGIVHRIDKDTSGLLVVAKTARCREGLKKQLQDHSMERRYDALVVGRAVSKTIQTLHGRDPKNRLRFSSDVSSGKEAVTHVRVEEIFVEGLISRVSCRLETGRTHQIRVHLSGEMKTPILADRLYGGYGKMSPKLVEVAQGLGRQALHAAVLGFQHPVTDVRLHFEVPLPADMQKALELLRSLS